MAQKRINFLNRDEFLEHLNELANSVTDTQQKIEIMKMIKDLMTYKEMDRADISNSLKEEPTVSEFLKTIGNNILAYAELRYKREEEMNELFSQTAKLRQI